MLPKECTQPGGIKRYRTIGLAEANGLNVRSGIRNKIRKNALELR
jgi:hypothetical protein